MYRFIILHNTMLLVFVRYASWLVCFQKTSCIVTYIVLISQTGQIHLAQIRSFLHTPSHPFSTPDRPIFGISNTHALYLPSIISHCHWFPHPQFIIHSHSSFVFVPQPNFWSTPTQLHVYSSIKLSKIPLIRYICLSNYTEPIKWNIQNNKFAFTQFG